jgi:hypothetical protein
MPASSNISSMRNSYEHIKTQQDRLENSPEALYGK